jgi:hypothetical protein
MRIFMLAAAALAALTVVPALAQDAEGPMTAAGPTVARDWMPCQDRIDKDTVAFNDVSGAQQKALVSRQLAQAGKDMANGDDAACEADIQAAEAILPH